MPGIPPRSVCNLPVNPKTSPREDHPSTGPEPSPPSLSLAPRRCPAPAGQMQKPLHVSPPEPVRSCRCQVTESETGFLCLMGLFAYGTERPRDSSSSGCHPPAPLTFGTSISGPQPLHVRSTHPLTITMSPHTPQCPLGGRLAPHEPRWSSWFQARLDPGPSNSVTGLHPFSRCFFPQQSISLRGQGWCHSSRPSTRSALPPQEKQQKFQGRF